MGSRPVAAHVWTTQVYLESKRTKIKMIPEMTELTDTPVKKTRTETETKTGVVTRMEASPGRRRMMAMVRQSSVNLSPYKGTKSQSFSSLHSVTKSPSQLSA